MSNVRIVVGGIVKDMADTRVSVGGVIKKTDTLLESVQTIIKKVYTAIPPFNPTGTVTVNAGTTYSMKSLIDTAKALGYRYLTLTWISGESSTEDFGMVRYAEFNGSFSSWTAYGAGFNSSQPTWSLRGSTLQTPYEYGTAIGYYGYGGTYSPSVQNQHSWQSLVFRYTFS